MLFGNFGFMKNKGALSSENNTTTTLYDENEAVKAADRYAAEAEQLSPARASDAPRQSAYRNDGAETTAVPPYGTNRGTYATNNAMPRNAKRSAYDTDSTPRNAYGSDNNAMPRNAKRSAYDNVKEPVPLEDIRPQRFTAEDYRARHRRLSGEIDKRLKK
ncbi:MAG: hypothetical protein LBT55_01835 [Clostridiaceae bacterium]|nr:hypothetical protein [Clostridiaceae bacterium]